MQKRRQIALAAALEEGLSAEGGEGGLESTLLAFESELDATVVSPDGIEGVELLLEPVGFPPAQVYQKALYEAGIPVFPATGNHDLSSDGAVAAVFGRNIPTNGPADEVGTTYALRHRNALVLVLNEYAGTNQYRVNQPWVDAVLATNTLSHVFALGHIPAFKLYHQDCLGLYAPERDAFWNSLSNAHARIYFGGHDHFYDHARLDDGDGSSFNDLRDMTFSATVRPSRSWSAPRRYPPSPRPSPPCAAARDCG